jgi:transposase
MSLPPRTIPDVPEETARVARAAFPKGNIYLQLRDEWGSIYQDDVFADLYSAEGQPAVRPWRLALVTVMQFMENLSDRQAADAVRGNIAWKYALSLDLTDAGFDFSVLSEFRQRLADQAAGERLLNEALRHFQAKGLVKARGQQRTDATHVLAAVRDLSRLENVGETLRYALHRLAEVAPVWLGEQVPAAWSDRYGPRFEQYRLPKSAAERRELADRIGQDGYDLLTRVYAATDQPALRSLDAVEILRQVWVQQFWCDQGQVRQRAVDNMPPVGAWIRSPFDVEARYGTKRQTEWVGYKAHLTETCDRDLPRLITHVATTPATDPDSTVTGSILDDLAAVDLLPAQHLVDAGYVEADHLVTSRTRYHVDLLGPAPHDQSWQARTTGGLTQAQFTIDWEARTVTCPAGHRNCTWERNRTARGQPVFRVRFEAATCHRCPLRARCTTRPPRQLTLLPQPQHDALCAARQRETTDAFQTTYRQRAGVEGTLSQAIRVGGLRRSRYAGLKKTHVQNLAIATALNLIRAVAWLNDIPLAPSRCSRFTTLAA